MYKVNLDGSIDVTTLEEALELQRRIRATQPKSGGQRSKNPQALKVNGHEHSFDDPIFAKLKPYNGQELDSEKMMGIIEAKDQGGVGPKLYHMKNRIPGLSDVLRERKTPRGHKFWRVKFP
jgi:hypothetical protein